MIQLIELLKYVFICTGYISNSNLFPEPLSIEEEKNYVDKYINGDIEAKNILITKNLRLVAYVVKKYSTTQVAQDDLISIGTIGLIKGIERYNNEKGTKYGKITCYN